MHLTQQTSILTRRIKLGGTVALRSWKTSTLSEILSDSNKKWKCVANVGIMIQAQISDFSSQPFVNLAQGEK